MNTSSPLGLARLSQGWSVNGKLVTPTDIHEKVTRPLLGLDPASSGRYAFVPKALAQTSLRRLRALLTELRKVAIGITHPVLGEPADWLLAAVIARENPLLLGSPGVAKTQLAMRVLELLGLEPPTVREDILEKPMPTANPYRWWKEREAQERMRPKRFHCLMSKFTQMEELFGPVEIRLLREGMLVRVNFGLLTGAGVYGCFLDEVFKSTSAILNALLTLSQEHRYFNWGAMQPADLLVMIVASNEMPELTGSGTLGGASASEDFQKLYAFVDRFAIRLSIPLVTGKTPPGKTPEESHLGQAFNEALTRECASFNTGEAFEGRDESTMPDINDVVCTGRAMLQHGFVSTLPASHRLFDPENEKAFRRAFVRVGTSLQQRGTNLDAGQVTWTISPRKLRSLYKIALAHALLCDDGKEALTPLRHSDLRVFQLVADSPAALRDLEGETDAAVRGFGSELGVPK